MKSLNNVLSRDIEETMEAQRIEEAGSRKEFNMEKFLLHGWAWSIRSIAIVLALGYAVFAARACYLTVTEWEKITTSGRVLDFFYFFNSMLTFLVAGIATVWLLIKGIDCINKKLRANYIKYWR